MFILRKKHCRSLGIIILLSILILISSINFVYAIRINEVMPNPADNCSDCTEWIELYSNTPMNLTNWIINTTNKQEIFNASIEDFLIITQNKTAFVSLWGINQDKVIEWSSMVLTNSGKNIFIFDNSSILIDNLIYPDFSSNENKSYSLLSNLSWTICSQATPLGLNLCEQNNTQNQTTPPSNDPEIYLELDYDSKIENGDEFNVKVKAYNLEDENYDIKVYLTKENTETIISETYLNKTWKSSTYYYENATEGDGNKTKTLKLRIDSDYNDFTGDAEIKAKIRINGETSVIASFEDTIEITEKKIVNTTTLSQKTTTQNTTKNSTEEIIKLNSIKEDLKTIKAKIYLSKTGYIKEFSVYFFALFCVFLLIYIMIRR